MTARLLPPGEHGLLEVRYPGRAAVQGHLAELEDDRHDHGDRHGLRRPRGGYRQANSGCSKCDTRVARPCRAT